MKILIGVDSHFQGYGGPFTAISEKLDCLQKKNIQFKLIYKSNSHFNYSYNLYEIIKEFDIIHIYGCWRPFLINLYYKSKKLKKKIIISPLGSLEPWALSQKKIKKLIAWHVYQKRILNNVDYIHATSEEEKVNIKKIGINTKIIVLPHGISVKKNHYKKIKKIKKKMIFFSRIHYKKGLLELIDVWKYLKNNKDWILEIYGPISDEKYLNKVKNLIKKNNLIDVIKIFDPVYNLKKKNNIFYESDCFILPSKSENFGLSIGEALSYGVPVITTTSTPWKIINDYNAGFVFDFSKENLLINLNKFLNLDESALEKMSLNAKRLISDKFDMQKVYNDYIIFYTSVMQ